MGDWLTEGSLARGIGKLDARAVCRRAHAASRPIGAPSTHEIVSDGYEVSPHAYKSCDLVAETWPSKTGRQLTPIEQSK